MATADAWDSFEVLRLSVGINTVDRLKFIIKGINDECGTALSKAGKKQDLIDRIIRQLDDWKASHNIDKWSRAKVVIQQIRQTGIFVPTPPLMSSSMTGGATYPALSQIKHSASAGSFSNHAPTGPRYDPYNPRAAAGPSRIGVTPTIHSLRFKPSPFFRIDCPVSATQECPESAHSQDRKVQTFSFTLTSDQVTKLKSDPSRYQLRLYCTSSTYHSIPFRHEPLCPIEFPSTCEIRVNGHQLTGNFKGMKKKAGTAPPAELLKIRLTPGLSNTVEMVYINTAQNPVPNKKYYLLVNLVEVTTVSTLVSRLKYGKMKSREEILRGMRKTAVIDDDIEAGPQKMSLKCPLSYARIQTPCRSSLCVHPQCFDATSWYSVMEQTTTWLCPVCERVLNVDDLIVDGYFDDILKTTPEWVEEIMVEADGEWHSMDGKYASSGWKTAVKQENGSLPPAKSEIVKMEAPEPSLKQNGIPRGVEVFILDSDDEDEGRVKREISPSYGTLSPTKPRVVPPPTIPLTKKQVDVIDLTLDSDEDELPPPSSSGSNKRKARDETDFNPSWKRPRLEAPTTTGVPLPPPPPPPQGPTFPMLTQQSTLPPLQYPGFMSYPHNSFHTPLHTHLGTNSSTHSWTP